MKKKKEHSELQDIRIRVDSCLTFKIDASPEYDAWKESKEDQRQTYVTERIKEYLLENIDEVVNDVLSEGNVFFENGSWSDLFGDGWNLDDEK